MLDSLIKKITGAGQKVYYNLIEVQAIDLNDYPFALKHIFERKIDGIIIRQALNGTEVAEILNHLTELPTEYKFEVDGCGGFLYPLTFNQLRDNENYLPYTERYFKHSQHFRENFSKIFKVDIENRFIDILQKLNDNRSAKVLHGIEPGTFLAPATMRVFPPQLGGVWAHCHNNDDIDLHPEFARHFENAIHTKGQLSFFAMLQKPDTGGQLSLINVEHKDAVAKRGAVEIIKKDGSIVRSDDAEQKMLVELNNGDMIIFAGGDIWHQVEDSGGNKSRVTVGGFGSFSRNNSDFYFWS